MAEGTYLEEARTLMKNLSVEQLLDIITFIKKEYAENVQEALTDGEK